jgi:Zn-finger nucleic acid-binding protein
MALTCPQCATALNEVKAEAITGYLIVLDQCPGCGGIWCDRWELYPITAAAAEQLDAVDRMALQQPNQAADCQLECPRCRARLFRFRDPAIPADARIERCPNCDGMWFNRGELRRFRERRMPSVASAQPASSQTVSVAQVDALAQRALGDRRSLPTVRALDDFDIPQQVDATASELREELKANTGWLVARAVLRLLLHV